MKKLNLTLTALLFGINAYCQQGNCLQNLYLVDGFIYANAIDKNIEQVNTIYRRESIFTFNYRFTDKNGKDLFFRITTNGNWDFISPNETGDGVVKDYQLKILNENMHSQTPKVSQIGISYIFDKKSAIIEMTGLIENEKNIWMHPPREYLFKILELSPYPYIKYPLEVGHRWNWKLQIGQHWGDKRWKVWSGNIENNYQYSIIGKETIKTSVGLLECYVIESEAKSELGTSKLTSYFNKQFGFVKLVYTNIDKSKLEINIQEVQKPIIGIPKI